MQTILLNKNYRSTLTLYNILYVLYLLVNLLSKSRLKEIGIFFNSKTHENSKVIGYAPKV